MSNENTNSIWLKEDEKIQLTLCGRTFLVSTHFSLNDLELYQELSAQEDDGKKALIHVIYSKFEQCDPPIPTPEELYTEHDNVFQPYMMNDVMLQAAQIAQQMARVVAPIQNAIAQFSSVFSNIIGQIQTPLFTDKQKRKLEENYRA